MEDGTHQGKNEYSFQAHYHTNLMQVFLKYYHVERLTQILNTYHKAARLIQNGTYSDIRYYYVVMKYTAITCWVAQRKLMEKKREEMIIKLQALLRGWLVRRSHQQQKAAIIRFQAGNIIPLAYIWLCHSL